MDLSPIDLKTLRLLAQQGRMSWAELGNAIGVTAPAAAERVHRLEEKGVIRGFAAIVDSPSIGFTLTAFVAVTLERPKHRSAFLKWVQKQPEVLEVHHTAGEDDYLLKVRCRDTAELDRIVGQELKDLDGIVRTRTTIVMKTEKENIQPPLSKGNA
jgi:Lrp/AsnC family leucine-responsive transcriptional regulator